MYCENAGPEPQYAQYYGGCPAHYGTYQMSYSGSLRKRKLVVCVLWCTLPGNSAFCNAMATNTSDYASRALFFGNACAASFACLARHLWLEPSTRLPAGSACGSVCLSVVPLWISSVSVKYLRLPPGNVVSCLHYFAAGSSQDASLAHCM